MSSHGGIAVCVALSCVIGTAAASPGPSGNAPIVPVAAPLDRPYPGEILLSVDVTDVVRRIFHVHEHISGVGPETVLLYPQWLPGDHAPEGPIDRIAGIRISGNSTPVAWTRDPANVYALRVHVAPPVRELDVDFDYLSPTSSDVGDFEITADLLTLEWNRVLLYPAGYFVRQIPVEARLRLPADWHWASALEAAATSESTTTFRRVSVETLVDSPLYAGRYFSRLDLDPGAAAPVHLDLFADRPSLLQVKPEQLAAHRELVRQAYRLFGSRHFAHYDFLYSLSDQVAQLGLEHQQSSENGTEPQLFTEWDAMAYDRDLLPHEFTHSWNGKFRRPADLWTPNYNVPMRDTLLWVYEGQTQYWGEVLAARAGLRTRQQALEQLAQTAAYYQLQAGRRWRSLQDTTNDEIINPRRPQSWRTWQRFEDYYDEGALIWLEADTLIRERSMGQRSLDEFARAFFGIDDGSQVTVTYTYQDIVRALNAVEPYDWDAFLRQRIDAAGAPPPLEGLQRGGYRLVYTDAPGDYLKARDEQLKRVDLLYSVGVEISDKDKPGTLREVAWGSPAFKAGLTEGAQIIAVNGAGYEAGLLKDAIQAARGTTAPIELIVRQGDRYTVAQIDYHDGLRYPHLQRDPSVPARLDDILAPRR